MLESFFYLGMLSFLSFFVGRILPYRWFRWDRYPFKSYPAEREGRLYLKIYINKWQNRVPDMSKIFPSLIPPKNMNHYTPENLPEMIAETCIAEVIHWGNSVLSLPVLWIWRGMGGWITVLIYIFLGNVPFALIQRYNRPRLLKLYHRMTANEESSSL